jgi:methionyl-tRNA formyltransferase
MEGRGVTGIYLTTDDPLYLPGFFERVLREHAADTLAVFIVPPLYRRQTALQAALRYARTFGYAAAAQLAARVALAGLRRQSIAAVCRRHGVACETVADVNAPEFLDRLKRLGPDLLISVSCPQIFKQPLIDLPPHGILNIHGALLPQYRGVLPSFWMLANGEKRAGVSIYYVDTRIDAGELCGQRAYDVLPDESLDAFLRRSKAAAAELLIEVLGRIERGEVTRTPLDLAQGSYYAWPDAEAVGRFRAAGRRLW